MEKELRQIRSAAYRRAQEIRGKADAQGHAGLWRRLQARSRLLCLLRTLEAYNKEGKNKNSVLILTTDSDYYRYKDVAGRKPGPARAAR